MNPQRFIFCLCYILSEVSYCSALSSFQDPVWRSSSNLGFGGLLVEGQCHSQAMPCLKEINPEYSLEGLTLNLKLQYFGHLVRRANSLEKNPDVGKDWRQEEKGMTEDEMVGWHHWLNEHEFEQTQEMLKDREAWCAAAHEVAKSQTWLSNWTTTPCLDSQTSPGQIHVTSAYVSLAEAKPVTKPLWMGQWEHSSYGKGGRRLWAMEQRICILHREKKGVKHLEWY